MDDNGTLYALGIDDTLLGPNPTSLLPGAISLAETVLVKDYWQLACTFGPMTPLQRLMQGFQVLKA